MHMYANILKSIVQYKEGPKLELDITGAVKLLIQREDVRILK